ncbi:uncharacterized protein LOC141902636 [Tubulanus polymorphus]|uniref:uncharacterized protein LOC141902636 n=1 Tax=Tubulanus polymorphus TaxID=672921 RepID=UPI003DA6B61B
MQNCYTKKDRSTGGEIADEQNERLTTKHIQTLSFLQEIVNENKQLKDRVSELEAQIAECAHIHDLAENSQDRIKEIQDQYLKRADEINEMLVEKHKVELNKINQDKLQDEQTWFQEKRQLMSEIERLEKELKAGSEGNKDFVSQLQMLTLKSEGIEQENERMTEEIRNLEQINSTQLMEIEKLTKNNIGYKKLSDEVDLLAQKNREQQLKIDKLEKQLNDCNDEEQRKLVDLLKTKLSKLHKEKLTFTEKETDFARIIDELRAEVETLKAHIGRFEADKLQLLMELEFVHGRVRDLESQLVKYQSVERDRNFKDFVAVKRTVNLLKDENDELKQKLVTKSKSTSMLPSLKGTESGYSRANSRRDSLHRQERKGSTASNNALQLYRK